MGRTINANFLANETIVIEDTKDFDESAFSPVYQKASDIILTIIERNGEEYCKTIDNSLIETVENIVAIEGRRGTGKTSVMRSIAEALRGSYKNEFLKENTVRQNCSFIISDYIDASSLEEGEDVLEMVLASMFSKLTEFENSIGGTEYESRELYRLFNEVYKTLLGLRRNSKRTEGSPIQILTQVSNSHTLRKNFAELVRKYLKYMGQQDNRNYYDQKRFLVICIDDLDMHYDGKKDTSYHLLESLHRYLMLPGVILLLTYNYKDLFNGCVKHFMNKRNTSDIEHEKNLAVQYLNKVIPIYARVTMPSLRKMDYIENNGVMISIDRDVAEGVIGKFTENFWKGKQRKTIEISVKKFVLLMRAGTAGLYYDAIGRKRHFTEPKSMRELAQTYTFMKYLNTLKKEENVLYKELLDDLYFRYANEVLSENEWRTLDAFLEVPIGRRSQDIVRDIREKYSKEWNADISKITYVHKSKFSYSYGELLYCLYVASSKGIYKKELIWCILESYTIMLTKLYRGLKKAKDNRENEKYRKWFKEIMSDSLASSWSNEYLPKVHTLQDAKQKKKQEYDFMILADEAVSLGAVRLEGSLLSFDFDLEGYENDAEIVLQTIEVLLMFFTGIHEVKSSSINETGIKFKYQPIEDDYKHAEGAEVPKFAIQICADCFNIMNFIKNIFEKEEFFDRIHKSLIHEFQKCYPDEDIEKLIKNHSLNNSKWYALNHRIAMPVYSFDMMYNIFKRLYTNQHHIPTEVHADKFWEYVHLVYKDTGNLLKEEDEYYFNVDNSKENTFFNIYNTCPFIDYINKMYEPNGHDEKKNKKRNKQRNLFEKNFSEMIINLYNISK